MASVFKKSKRGDWQLGRVEQAVADGEGVVRRVMLRTRLNNDGKTKVLERPAAKLVLLVTPNHKKKSTYCLKYLITVKTLNYKIEERNERSH